MKNIFGEELSENVAKCYKYMFAPNGGSKEAMLLAKALGVKKKFRKILQNDAIAFVTIQDAFCNTKTGVYLQLSRLLDCQEHRSKIHKSICKNQKYSFDTHVLLTESHVGGIFTGGFYPISWLVKKYKIEKRSAKYDELIEKAKSFSNEKAFNSVKDYVDKSLLSNYNLPKIDWNMVKFNINLTCD